LPVASGADSRFTPKGPTGRDPKNRGIFLNERIFGERISLRPVTMADEQQLVTWFSDESFVEWWGGRPLVPSEILKQYGAQALRDTGESIQPLIVELEGEPIGFLHAWKSDAKDSGGIDMVLEPRYIGHGYGPDAMRTFARHLRMHCGWPCVSADPDERNLRSIAAFEKAGFVRTGARITGEDGTSILMEYR
jgi:aminoglycoside 6'-N-acetyltransferase